MWPIPHGDANLNSFVVFLKIMILIPYCTVYSIGHKKKAQLFNVLTSRDNSIWL